MGARAVIAGIGQTAFGKCPDCRSLETCEIRPILLAVRDTTALLLEGMSLAEAAGRERISFVADLPTA